MKILEEEGQTVVLDLRITLQKIKEFREKLVEEKKRIDSEMREKTNSLNSFVEDYLQKIKNAEEHQRYMKYQ